MGVDIDQPGLDFGDPVRIVRGVGLAQQRVALEVGLEHDLDQALRAVGRFLRQAADAPARRDGDRAALGRRARRGWRWNSVDLPVPLRPTRPTRAPGAICTEL